MRRNYLDFAVFLLQLDVLFGNLPEMVEFQVEFLKTLEDGTRLVPDLEKLESVDQFKVYPLYEIYTKRYDQQQTFKTPIKSFITTG